MSAAVAGLSEATIQQLGGWRSGTWRRYIQMPDSVLAGKAASMAQFPVQSMVADQRNGGCASSVRWAEDCQAVSDIV